MLAGLVRAPSQLAPSRNIEAARDRAGLVLAAMVQTGAITQAERTRPAPTRPSSRFAGIPPDSGYRPTPRRPTQASARCWPDRPDAGHHHRSRDGGARRSQHRRSASTGRATRSTPPRPRSSPGTGRRDRFDGGRTRLRRQPVQPRHTGQATARLAVQALRLHDCPASGLTPESRVVDRPSGSATGSRRIAETTSAARSAQDRVRPLDQHGGGEPG